MPNKRDDFSEIVKRTAAERVAYRCSFPGCQMITIGASQEKADKSSRTGVAAHICAAAEGGPRYDANMTPEERKDITNCIWMCQTHAHLIDTDVVTYTVDKLKEMKKEAEEAATKRLGNAELLQFDNQNIELDKYEIFLKRLIADGDYESLNYMLRRYNDLCVGNLQELIIRYKIHFDVYCCIDLLESDLNDYIALPNKSGINDLMELFICFLMPNELGKIISYCENEELKKYANKIIENNIDSIFLRTKDCDTTTLEEKKDYLDMYQKALSNFIAQKNFALIKDTEGNYVNLYNKEFFYKVQASVVSLFRKGILNNIYYSDENNDENFVYIRDNLDKISALDPCRQEYIWETILRYCMKNITKFNEFYDKCPEAVKQTAEMKGFKMYCDFVNDPLSVDENDIIKFAEDNNAYHILIEYVKSLSSEKRIEFLDEHQYLYRRDSYFLLLRLDLYPQKFESEEAFGLIDKYKEAHKDDFLFHCLRARVAPEQERKKEDEWLKRYNDQIELQQLKMYFELLTYEKDFDTLSSYINAPLPNEDLYYLAMRLINSESLKHLNQTHAILEKLIEQKFIVNGIYHNLAYIDNKLGRASQTKEFLAKEYDKNQSIESLLRLLFLRFETKDFQEDKYLNAASEIIDEEAQVLVGLTYLNLNKKEEAKPHLLKALFLNDSETYLYYLNTRYYDPQIKRFINADTLDNLGANGDLNAFNLYAYCSNNPVMCVDPFGEFLILILVAVNHTVSVLNKNNNEQVEKNSESKTQGQTIDHQSEMKDFNYGIRPADKTSCEAIAIHNAKVYFEIDSNLGDTINDCQKQGGMWLLGVFGTKPWKIDNILESYGISCISADINNISEPGVYIVSYFIEGNLIKGIHTVTFEYDGINYKYYNKAEDERYKHPKEFAYSTIVCYKLERG